MTVRFDRVIWDFNGTILDDVRAGIDSANELLARYQLAPISSVEQYHRLFGFPIRSYYERLGFDFSRYDFETLAHEWVAIYLRRVKDAPARPGIKKTISDLRRLGLKQTVLSMTETDMLHRQLSFLGLENDFDEICGLDNVYASGKLSLAAAWRDNHPGEHAILVGDTSHDAKSAAVIGCPCLLITGGHESTESLRKTGLPLIERPADILSFLS